MTELQGATAAAATPAEAVAPAALPVPSSRRRRRPSRKFIELVVLIGPALVLFAGFVLLPICIAAYYGLFNWTGYGPLSDFTGLHNYKLVLGDPVFRSSLLHNVIIAVLSLVIQLPISVAIALLLNRRMRGSSFLRMAVFAPYVVSQATTAVLWLLLLQPGGFVDELMESVGLG